jgi:hypothetical protein
MGIADAVEITSHHMVRVSGKKTRQVDFNQGAPGNCGWGRVERSEECGGAAREGYFNRAHESIVVRVRNKLCVGPQSRRDHDGSAILFLSLVDVGENFAFFSPVAKDVWEAGLFVQFLEEQDMVSFL